MLTHRDRNIHVLQLVYTLNFICGGTFCLVPRKPPKDSRHVKFTRYSGKLTVFAILVGKCFHVNSFCGSTFFQVPLQLVLNCMNLFVYSLCLCMNVITVTPRYNTVVGRHLLRPPYKRGALWDPVDLFDIIHCLSQAAIPRHCRVLYSNVAQK